jgi:hypothetical protein
MELEKFRRRWVVAVLGWLSRHTWWIPLAFALLVASVELYAYRALEHSTRAQLARELRTILQADVEALNLWVQSRESVTRAEARRSELLSPAEALLELVRAAPDPHQALSDASAAATLRQHLLPVLEEYGFASYALLDPGALVLAGSQGPLVGRRLAVEAQLFERVLEGETIFARAVRDAAGGDAAAFAASGIRFHTAAPVRDARGRIIAVLAFVIRANGGFSDILQVARMGESGETYAFDDQGVMLSESRFVDQLVGIGLLPEDPAARETALVRIRDPGGSLAEGHVPELPVLARPLTRMAAEAVTQQAGLDVEGYRDYRGVEVIGAWTWLPELRLGITTEIDRAEAYTGLAALRRIFGSLAALLLLGAVTMCLYTVLLGRLRRGVERARKLGRYEMLEKIGEGGMGKVYRARHAMLRRPTAVKLLEAAKASDEAVQRFEREVQASSGLTHPNTISIFDYGRTPDGTFYYAMEYLEGITIGELVSADGAQPEARIVHLMRQASASLAEAHAAGLIHRDLKPSNIMLCLRGGMLDFVKVLDFGLVRGEDRSGDLELTSASSLTGTPLYISPEALEAPETMTASSDVYQLGAIFYYLLTGSHVFTGESLVEILGKHLNKPPVAPSELLGRPVSPDLEELVLACLDKDPLRRPESGAALLEAFEHCRVEGVWTQRDAREWWVHFEERRTQLAEDGETPTGSLPSGWQVQLDGRTGFSSESL